MSEENVLFVLIAFIARGVLIIFLLIASKGVSLKGLSTFAGCVAATIPCDATGLKLHGMNLPRYLLSARAIMHRTNNPQLMDPAYVFRETEEPTEQKINLVRLQVNICMLYHVKTKCAEQSGKQQTVVLCLVGPHQHHVCLAALQQPDTIVYVLLVKLNGSLHNAFSDFLVFRKGPKLRVIRLATTLYKSVSVAEFVMAEKHLTLLAYCSKLEFDRRVRCSLTIPTTDEIRMLCEDVKVLGPTELRQLVRVYIAG